MKVKEYLPKVKANRYTYYNLDKKTKRRFQQLYNYLKRHKEKDVSNYFQLCDSIKGSVKYWLNSKCYIEYIRKYEAMKIISQAIKFK